MMLTLFITFLFCLSNQFKVCNADPFGTQIGYLSKVWEKGENRDGHTNVNLAPIQTCYRLRRSLMIHHETTSLFYIKIMWKEIQELRERNTIRNSTADMLSESLERMTHGWCNPAYNARQKVITEENKRTKRSISVFFATIFAFGSLIIGPAIGAVIHEISQNTKWRMNSAKEALASAHILAEFEKHIDANEKIDEILASIFLHESIMTDLLQRPGSKRMNRTWKKIFKEQIRLYKELGFIEESDEEILGMEDNLLPKGSYSFKATVHKNEDCGETRIKIRAVGLIPDETCYYKHTYNNDTSLITLKADTSNKCIFTGNDTTNLLDRSILITTNAIIGPCNNSNSFEFENKNSTLLVRPVTARAYMISTCGKTVKKTILYRDQFYALPILCDTWLSNERKNTPNPDTDFFQSAQKLIDAGSGSKIKSDAVHPKLIFFAINEVKDLEGKEKTKIRWFKDQEYIGFINHFLNTPNEEPISNQTKIVASLGTAALFLLIAFVVCKIRKRSLTMKDFTNFLKSREVRTETVEEENIIKMPTVFIEVNKSAENDKKNGKWEKVFPSNVPVADAAYEVDGEEEDYETIELLFGEKNITIAKDADNSKPDNGVTRETKGKDITENNKELEEVKPNKQKEVENTAEEFYSVPRSSYKESYKSAAHPLELSDVSPASKEEHQMITPDKETEMKKNKTAEEQTSQVMTKYKTETSKENPIPEGKVHAMMSTHETMLKELRERFLEMKLNHDF